MRIEAKRFVADLKFATSSSTLRPNSALFTSQSARRQPAPGPSLHQRQTMRVAPPQRAVRCNCQPGGELNRVSGLMAFLDSDRVRRDTRAELREALDMALTAAQQAIEAMATCSDGVADSPAPAGSTALTRGCLQAELETRFRMRPELDTLVEWEPTANLDHSFFAEIDNLILAIVRANSVQLLAIPARDEFLLKLAEFLDSGASPKGDEV